MKIERIIQYDHDDKDLVNHIYGLIKDDDNSLEIIDSMSDSDTIEAEGGSW